MSTTRTARRRRLQRRNGDNHIARHQRSIRRKPKLRDVAKGIKLKSGAA